ncbi:MAG: hypothetical protein ACI4SR_08180 [Faecalibacillus sp.]
MKNLKKIAVTGLSLLMVSTMTTPVLAIEIPSKKEEVIYIMTKANGDVKNINVVNIFDGGDILDYGDYSSVKMLTTNNKIKKINDKITFSSDDKRVYYQGTMKSKEIPWNISICYFLDGKEYSSKKIAGKSGSLEIRLKIRENENYEANEYNQYALQANLTLDTDHCQNIKAEDATIVNVGSDKQISYTILPGKGIETSIYADVEDFEMDAISINGIQLNLDIDIDSSKLTEKVEELIDAMYSLDKGAASLSNGSQDIKTGSTTLNNGILTLNSGMGELNTGVIQLQSGMSTLENGLNELNKKSESLNNGSTQMKEALSTIESELNSIQLSIDQATQLTEASSQIKQGIFELNEGIQILKNSVGYQQYKSLMKDNGVDIDQLKQGNDEAIKSLSAMINTLNSLNEKLEQLSTIPGMENQITELEAQIANLNNLIILFQGNNAAIVGTEMYLNEVSKNIGILAKNMEVLNEKYNEFDTAIQQMATSLNEMIVNMSKLTNAINILTKEYKNLDQGIHDYTDGVAQVVAGYKQMIKGVSSLASGSQDLLKGTESLSQGSQALYNGVVSLCDGAGELANGTKMLKDETSYMSDDVKTQIDDILSSIQGDDAKINSFVSHKNKNVESVQFVIKTEEIKKVEKEKKKETKKQEKNLLEKFLELFKK